MTYKIKIPTAKMTAREWLRTYLDPTNTKHSARDLMAVAGDLMQRQEDEINRLTLALKDSRALGLRFAQEREAADAEIARLVQELKELVR